MYVARSDNSDAVKAARELQARVRAAVVLFLIAALMVAILHWAPEDFLATWASLYVLVAVAAVVGGGVAIMLIDKSYDALKTPKKSGKVRRVGWVVRFEYKLFVMRHHVNPSRDELFDYAKERETALNDVRKTLLRGHHRDEQ